MTVPNGLLLSAVFSLPLLPHFCPEDSHPLGWAFLSHLRFPWCARLLSLSGTLALSLPLAVSLHTPLPFLSFSVAALNTLSVEKAFPGHPSCPTLPVSVRCHRAPCVHLFSSYCLLLNDGFTSVLTHQLLEAKDCVSFIFRFPVRGMVLLDGLGEIVSYVTCPNSVFLLKPADAPY